jgi:snapalysin
MLKRTVIGLFAATAALVGGVVVPSAIADVDGANGRDVGAAAVTITYDDSQAPEYVDAITQAIQIWNDSVNNVEITHVQPGQQAEVSFESFDGWPQAELGPIMPGGHGTIWMGKEAVDEGYNVLRIAAHEFGHSLGLPDVKPGPCESLMSGSTGGVDCTNAQPNAEEIAQVEENYAGGAAAKPQQHKTVVIGWLDD